MEEKGKVAPPNNRRRSKVLVFVVPIVFIPLVTIFLVALGVIGTKPGSSTAIKDGINRLLPAPRNGKDSNWNKLSFYQQSERDSIKYRSLLRNDPLYKSALTSSQMKGQSDSSGLSLGSFGEGSRRLYDPYRGSVGNGMEANTSKVFEKIAVLNAAIKRAEQRADSAKQAKISDQGKEEAAIAAAKIPGASIAEPESDAPEDKQMKRMDGMLEKILEIKYPERGRGKVDSVKGQSFPVRRATADPLSSGVAPESDRVGVTANDTAAGFPTNGFFSDEDGPELSESVNAIRAVIPDMPTLVTGNRVRLRLLQPIVVRDNVIPANTFVWGITSFSGQRMNIHIASIEYRGNIIPVSLSVYDLDGMPGINAPGSAERDVAKQSTDQAVQSLSLATLDESVGAQAATAGIQAAKTLISKKVRLVRVQIPSNYEVLLRDDSIKK